MARAGYGSRRACETIIEQKRVTVNGVIATLGTKADPDRDDIRVDGVSLRLPDAYDYIMLNKPRGVVSDEDVGGNWPVARDLIPVEGHLYPVGRLDIRSEGLMLFTNDGDLAHRLTHPSYEHPKTYRVLVAGDPGAEQLEAWQRGVVLDGQRTLPAEVRRVRRHRGQTWLEVTMREGRKRQIRRVASLLGLEVLHLERIGLGPLKLGDLPTGAWRRLTEEEVNALRQVRRQRKPFRPAKRQVRRKDREHPPRSRRTPPTGRPARKRPPQRRGQNRRGSRRS